MKPFSGAEDCFFAISGRYRRYLAFERKMSASKPSNNLLHLCVGDLLQFDYDMSSLCVHAITGNLCMYR